LFQLNYTHFILGMIIFSWVRFLSKKITKPKFYFFIKKTETGSNRPVSVWFFRTKTGSNRFDSVFSVWLKFGSVFSGLAWFFFVWLGFFRFFYGLGSVKFFQFQTYKTETKPNRSVFFKILISFLVFFAHPYFTNFTCMLFVVIILFHLN